MRAGWPAPSGAKERLGIPASHVIVGPSRHDLLSPLPGLSAARTADPRLAPWATALSPRLGLIVAAGAPAGRPAQSQRHEPQRSRCGPTQKNRPTRGSAATLLACLRQLKARPHCPATLHPGRGRVCCVMALPRVRDAWRHETSTGSGTTARRFHSSAEPSSTPPAPRPSPSCR